MNKDISIKSFIIVLSVLIFIELFIMLYIIPSINYQKLAKHCSIAACNPSNTICYNYGLEKGKTVVTWRGDCTKYYE